VGRRSAWRNRLAVAVALTAAYSLIVVGLAVAHRAPRDLGPRDVEIDTRRLPVMEPALVIATPVPEQTPPPPPPEEEQPVVVNECQTRLELARARLRSMNRELEELIKKYAAGKLGEGAEREAPGPSFFQRWILIRETKFEAINLLPPPEGFLPFPNEPRRIFRGLEHLDEDLVQARRADAGNDPDRVLFQLHSANLAARDLRRGLGNLALDDLLEDLVKETASLRKEYKDSPPSRDDFADRLRAIKELKKKLVRAIPPLDGVVDSDGKPIGYGRVFFPLERVDILLNRAFRDNSRGDREGALESLEDSKQAKERVEKRLRGAKCV